MISIIIIIQNFNYLVVFQLSVKMFIKDYDSYRSLKTVLQKYKIDVPT